jgi:hypothetical protein
MWRLPNFVHRLLSFAQKKITKNEGEMSREHEAILIASGIKINKAFYFVGKKKIEVILNDTDPSVTILDRYSQIGYNVVLYKVKRYKNTTEVAEAQGQLSDYSVEKLYGRAKELYNNSRK